MYTARHGFPSPQQCLGGKHIERIFGASSSCLELFLLKRKLIGPCWITIKSPRTISESVSWCSVEVGVENPKFVTKVSGGDKPLITDSHTCHDMPGSKTLAERLLCYCSDIPCLVFCLMFHVSSSFIRHSSCFLLFLLTFDISIRH